MEYVIRTRHSNSRCLVELEDEEIKKLIRTRKAKIVSAITGEEPEELEQDDDRETGMIKNYKGRKFIRTMRFLFEYEDYSKGIPY
jgi:hypothetical protein